jgi:TetR/AcrR family transcriptional repressor of nem operon
MRKSKQEAAETRRRIVKAAAAKFRQNGIGGTGLSDLMAAAGLTHGGFYRHFDSKDQIVAEACAAATESAIATFFSNKSPQSGLKARVAKYLSPAHRDDPSAGCPLAALGSEDRPMRRKNPRSGDAGLSGAGGDHRRGVR